MKTWIRHSIATFSIAVLSGGIIYLSRQIRSEERGICCQGADITVCGEDEFVSKTDLTAYINNHYGNFVGQTKENLKLDEIEKILNGHWFIRSSQVWLTNDGILHVQAFQKKPVIRFIQGASGFYIDSQGKEFPLCDKWSASVPEVHGCIQGRNWIDAALPLSTREDLTRIDVDSQGNILLHTSKGPEDIVFGQPVRIQEKLSLLDRYYERIVPAKGAAASVDIRCRGRIVCKL